MQSMSSGNVERSRNASGSRSSQSLDFRPSRAMRRCWDVPIGSVGHCSEAVPTQPSSRKTSMRPPARCSCVCLFCCPCRLFCPGDQPGRQDVLARAARSGVSHVPGAGAALALDTVSGLTAGHEPVVAVVSDGPGIDEPLRRHQAGLSRSTRSGSWGSSRWNQDCSWLSQPTAPMRRALPGPPVPGAREGSPPGPDGIHRCADRRPAAPRSGRLPRRYSALPGL